MRSQKKVHFAEERNIVAEPERREPKQLLAFGRQDEENADEPANWQAHLKDLDWNANLKALEIELNSHYNYRWWDSPTPEVSIEWPTMRKWAAETLKDCLDPKRNRRFLSPSRVTQFMGLLQPCAPENLRFLVFKEPMSSLVENLDAIEKPQPKSTKTASTSVLPEVPDEDGDSEADIEQYSTRSDKPETSSVFMDDVWSLSACNVDPVPVIRSRNYLRDELLFEPIGETAFDWEPPELKALDFQANLDALSIAMKLPVNADWDTTQTIYIKDAALRQWASETANECMGTSSRQLTANQRQDFFQLFEEKIPTTYLRSISFLNPVSILGSIEELEDSKVGKEQQQMESDNADDDSESSVYI
jgi:hypothetical protein